MAIALAVAIWLASYVPAQLQPPEPARTLFGAEATKAATYLYGLFGIGAWALVAFFAALGWRINARKPLAGPARNVVGVALGVLTGALAAAIHWPLTTWPMHSELGGGIVGDVLYGAVVPAVSGVTGLGPKSIGVLAAWFAVAGIHMAVGGEFPHLRSYLEPLQRLAWIGLAFRRAPRAAPARPVETEAPLHVLDVPDDEPAKRRRRKKSRATDHDVVQSEPTVEWQLPPIDLLAEPEPAPEIVPIDEEALNEKARRLESVLADFGVQGEVSAVHPGPVVTLFEFEPARGTKTSRVTGLADDISRSMSATSTRAAAIPGRRVIGIEIPNEDREIVRLRELLENVEARRKGIPIALGKDIGGNPFFADLSAMPHVLIAGTTGSGKSVGINTMILSLLFRMTPNDCRLILIDPKMLEMTAYSGIPHLLSPVVTDSVEAAAALNWVVGEMESRYKAMSAVGAKSMTAYNERVAKMAAKAPPADEEAEFDPDLEADVEANGEEPDEDAAAPPSPMPNIVVVIDEVADLMLAAGKEVETAVQRIAQKARAAGIHLVMATQRPSTDVITGTIKANFPTRISFRVSSKIDSRTILGDGGAEQLLGNGDMLYTEGGGKMVRVHGAFVSDEEVEGVADFLRAQGEPDYVDAVTGGEGLQRE